MDHVQPCVCQAKIFVDLENKLNAAVNAHRSPLMAALEDIHQRSAKKSLGIKMSQLCQVQKEYISFMLNTIHVFKSVSRSYL